MTTKTIWLPSISDRNGPKYLRIVDALAEDVYSGRLNVGDRLPTHRDLAWRLAVTVGTVSRAYAEAERRGLLVGEVGRGSYVRAGARSAANLAMPAPSEPPVIELGVNRPPGGLADAAFAAGLTRLGQSPDLGVLLNYEAYDGRWDHRVAAAEWIAARGLVAPAERIVLTCGAQHAIAAALTAFCDPGGDVLVEGLTWPGTRAVASLLRLNLRPLPMDEQGIVPEALDIACRAGGGRVLYTMPTLQNPTGATQSPQRRASIAAVARRHDLTILEDDVYGFLSDEDTPPLAAFAAERTIFVTSTSKSISPALRVGVAVLPQDRIARFGAAARAMNWMPPTVMAELFARWVADGTAEALAEDTRQEMARRQAMARRRLEGFEIRMAPHAFHLWLTLPEPWRVPEVVSAARRRGLSLTSTDLFVAGRATAPHGLRVSLSAPLDCATLDRGLGELVALLQETPEPCLAEA